VLGVDRLDYTKGPTVRLKAFEHFIKSFPRYLEKVSLLFFVMPSRESVELYKTLKKELDELVGRINSAYGTLNWVPVWYFYRQLDLEERMDLYKQCEIALITPIRDGMNLIAKEYLATRTGRTGVLIISEMAGAAKELSEAIIVNPNNPIGNLTLQQLSDIYSGKINNWKELGGEDRPIVRLSRETNSGTHVYFLEQVLRLGDKESDLLFSTDTLLLPSSEVIGAEIRQNPNAIGYDGLGYVTPDMKVVAVADARESGQDFIFPSPQTVNDGSYPIARDLYMYTAGEPSGFVKSYLNWIFTPQSQEIVTQLGFVPIPVQ